MISGNGSLVKTGAGTLTISGGNTYTGDTTVSAGTLAVSGGLSVGAGATLNINSGAALNLHNGSADAYAVLSMDGRASTAPTANLNGGSSTTGVTLDVGVNGLGTVVQAGGATASFNTLELGVNAGGNGTFTLTGGTMTTSFVVAGEEGTGTIVQSGGTFTASRGLVLGLETGGNGTYRLNGGTLNTPGVIGLDGQYNPAFGEAARSTSAFYFNGGMLLATGTNGSTDFTPATTVFFAGVTAGGAIITTKSCNVTFAQNLVHDPASGAPAVDGGLTKLGPGTLTLAGDGTFTGTTSVATGTLDLANQFASSQSTLDASGGSVTFDPGVAANAFTFGGLTGNGALALAANSGANLIPSALTVGANNTSTSFEGTLYGRGSLIKALNVANGTATLGNVTIRGALAVNSATAAFDDGEVSGSGTVTGGGGGTLNTQGAEIQGVTTVSSGGTLSATGPSLSLTAGPRTSVDAGGTLPAANGTAVELNGSLLVNNGTQTGTLNMNYGSTATGTGSFGGVAVNPGGQFGNSSVAGGGTGKAVVQ